MKLLMKLYDRCKLPIRVMYIAFVMVAFGTLIRSESVNIFYTFKNSFLLMLADGCLALGQTLVINMPLFFMVNYVCKKANSGVPIVLALIGYFTFTLTTSLFVSQSLMPQAYLGANAFPTLVSNGRLPLQTGLIGAFIVAYVVRFSFIHSRHRTSHSLLGFLKKDSAAVIYCVVLSAFAGILVSYFGSYCYNFLAYVINYIAADLMDPFRLAIYGVVDRLLSILGINEAIRSPFWFSSLGGSYQTLGGQIVLGDVNIWNYVKDVNSDFVGAGRFVTGYYVINLFLIPAILFGTYFSLTDKLEKRRLLIPLVGAFFLSFVCGNPLPYELTLLVVSPLLLVIYLLAVWLVFFVLGAKGLFLGCSLGTNYIASAMPGNFFDLIINIRSFIYFDTIMGILKVGVVAFVLLLAMTMIYYRFVTGAVSDRKLVEQIVEAAGGKENIAMATAGLYRLNLYLREAEDLSFEKVKLLGAYRVIETRYGVALEFGVLSFFLARRISSYIVGAVED